MTQSAHTPGPVAEAFDLLNDSRVRDYIGRKLGEQAKLHRVLNALRPAGACAVREAAPDLLRELIGAAELLGEECPESIRAAITKAGA